MPKGNLEGVLVPVVTPFAADLTPDRDRFVAFCHWLVSQGADGLAIFGTTSEANSMSLRQREDLFDALIGSGMPAAKLMPGAGAAAIDDAVRMTRMAVEAGCGGVLVHPPFYYKSVTDDGVVAFYSEVIERVGDSRLKLYLYHIPGQTMVSLGIDLVGRLISAYPDTVVGLKDSGGDWTHTEALIREYSEFDVFPSSEAFLLPGLRAGGRGCITATGNINVAGISSLIDSWQTEQAEALQSRLTEVRRIVQAYPLIPAVKAVIARFRDTPDWRRVSPPLVSLAEDDTRTLLDNLARIGFALAPAETATA